MKNLRVLTFALVAAASTWTAAAFSQTFASTQKNSTPSEAAKSAPAHKASFKNAASTTGWLEFNFYTSRRVYVPAKINGQDVLVWLIDGAETSSIDKDFAASLGLEPKAAGAAPATVTVQIQIGDLTLRDVQASPLWCGDPNSGPCELSAVDFVRRLCARRRCCRGLPTRSRYLPQRGLGS